MLTCLDPLARGPSKTALAGTNYKLWQPLHCCKATAMEPELFWTGNRKKQLQLLVRSLAFDFNKVAAALREDCEQTGIPVPEDALDPASLRQVYATVGKKRGLGPSKASVQPQQSTQSCGSEGPSAGTSERGNSMASHSTGLAGQINYTLAEPIPVSSSILQPMRQGLEMETMGSVQRSGLVHRQPAPVDHEKRVAPPTQGGRQLASQDTRSFHEILADQRVIEAELAARQAAVLARVLEAVGGGGGGARSANAVELPADVQLAWDRGIRQKQAEERAEEERRQRDQEAEFLLKQRQSLQLRHRPGSSDSIGQDPLGDSGHTSNGLMAAPSRQLAASPAANRTPPGPVKLELGFDETQLDELLKGFEDPYEDLTSGARASNSELAWVLSYLDAASGYGDPPPTDTGGLASLPPAPPAMAGPMDTRAEGLASFLAGGEVQGRQRALSEEEELGGSLGGMLIDAALCDAQPPPQPEFSPIVHPRSATTHPRTSSLSARLDSSQNLSARRLSSGGSGGSQANGGRGGQRGPGRQSPPETLEVDDGASDDDEYFAGHRRRIKVQAQSVLDKSAAM